jgi:arabinose-5-phosphate isomerase
MTQSDALIKSALRTIEIENKATQALLSRMDQDFVGACNLILNSRGRVIVTGMGKSGHIGRKIAATMASTGTPAHYVHPGEASHGDIGMITSDDVVIAISNSGNTAEITALLPVLKRKGVSLISFTGNKDSELASAADFNLDASVEEEACPLGLAPTSSTTVALVLGDALAMALLEARGFTPDDFAVSHPGGSLGRRLLVRVSDVMHAGAEIPRVLADTPIMTALVEMSNKGFGMTTVNNAAGELLGVFTDGDLRRAIDSGKDVRTLTIGEAVSSSYRFILKSALAAEAAKIMEETNVYVLIVKDENDNLVGMVKMHDLLQAKVV